jgi:hypothetical protein
MTDFPAGKHDYLRAGHYGSRITLSAFPAHHSDISEVDLVSHVREFLPAAQDYDPAYLRDTQSKAEQQC